MLSKKIQGEYTITVMGIPRVLFDVKRYLQENILVCSKSSIDGRVNSCIDEELVLEKLSEKFGNTIKIPKIRMWYDVLIRDDLHGWIPVNIKTTTMKTSDNIGNLALCVYSYTNNEMHLYKRYRNGEMSRVLFEKLKTKEYNTDHLRDYYFLVINKNNTEDIIINSMKGLRRITPNSNNLPFQVCWDKNREYEHKNIHETIKKFTACIRNTKPSWKEKFISNMKKTLL